MSDNFNMYDRANQQGNPNIPPMPPMEEKKGMSIASMVLGIIGLVFWCIPILGVPIGIVGLILGIVGRKRVEGAWQPLVLLCQLLPSYLQLSMLLLVFICKHQMS